MNNKLLFETWRKFLLKEESKFSQELSDLKSGDQKLRKLWQIEMEKAGGWSQELFDKFIEKHGTSKGDMFGDKQNKTEEKFLELFPNLDFNNFSDEDWGNFNTLIIHLREPQYIKQRQKALSEMMKAKKWWRSLATDMAREAKMLPEFDGVKLSYGKTEDDDDGGKVDKVVIKKFGGWEQLAKKLGVKL